MKKLALIFLAILTLLTTSCTEDGNDKITVDILDIGKADCIIIRIRDHTVMIDTGEKENSDKIRSFLQTKRISKIDTLILSHFDKDHIGCAAEMITDYGAGRLIISSFSSDREEYGEFRSAAEKQNVETLILTENFTFEIGTCRFSVFPPKLTNYDRKEDNNASLIVEMEYGQQRLLFCGDAMEERIDEFLSENHGEYDFVKLPYHGRYLSNYLDFLESTNPKHTAMTCSEKNPPDEKTVKLLKDLSIHSFNTNNGNVHVDLGQTDLYVTQ